MWECVKCHELGEDGFQICWNCGASQTGEEDPTFVKEREDLPSSAEQAPLPAMPEPPAERPSSISTSEGQASSTVPKETPSDSPLSVRPAPWPACPKCRSKRVLAGGQLKQVGEAAIQVFFFKRPGQIFFPGPVRADIQVYVCGDCGYTEMYTQHPEELAKVLPAAETQEQG